MEGPANVWYGFGFDAFAMIDAPWTIIVSGQNVFELDLANLAPGANLTSSIKVVSNTVTGDKRTVVVTRAMAGLSKSYYTFDPVKKA